MITDPARLVDQLQSMLGLTLDPSALDVGEAPNDHITAPSVEASIGRWRTELGARDAEVVQRRLREPMARFGYVTS